MASKDDLKRKRDRAIKQLRNLGMTDAEIEAEIGQPLTHVDSERGSSSASDNDAEIIDAEIVENLPAVINESYGQSAPVEDRPQPSIPGRDETNRSTIAENVAEYDASLEKNAERRCTATNSKGKRCRKYAIFGGRVCKTHGGAAPHVIEKARIKLAMQAVPLIGKLSAIAFDDSKPAAVQLDAVKDALNRIGVTKPAQVEVGPIKPYEEIFEGIYSGPRSESIDSQRESIGIDEHQPPPAPATSVNAANHSTDSQAGYDYCPPFAPQADEPPPRRQTHRPEPRNRYEGLTDEDALDLVNTENARNHADPPPPRPMRALPPGRGR